MAEPGLGAWSLNVVYDRPLWSSRAAPRRMVASATRPSPPTPCAYRARRQAACRATASRDDRLPLHLHRQQRALHHHRYPGGRHARRPGHRRGGRQRQRHVHHPSTPTEPPTPASTGWRQRLPSGRRHLHRRCPGRGQGHARDLADGRAFLR
jgi:hypothetical protein